MTDELRIYFAGAVRGDSGGAQLARRIEQLSELGYVLTEHMASPKTVDMGHTDDASIHAHDAELLARAHIFVADLAAPSTGSGYMIARASARGIPVLCLYPAGSRASAMIAGAPDIATRFYEDDDHFMRHVRELVLARAGVLANVHTRARRIFLAGPPGSGKGTLGVRLGQTLGVPHISTGELLRTLVATQPDHPLARSVKGYMDAGQLVPAEVMRDIVVDRLGQADCRLLGFILDGYPPSLADLENLRGRVEPDIVLYLDVSDATAVARQVARAARSTDTPQKARDRIAAFHEAHAEFDELATRWYPTQLVARIDAEPDAATVEAQVRLTLRNTSIATRHERSFFPLPPVRADRARSTRVHFHVDAPDLASVRMIAHAILARDKAAQGQLKIYPIRSLHLGGQQRRLPIYERLPNFHPIDQADHEAFITGRLGDGDRALMQIVLEETRARGGMAELEEYVGEWTLGRDGTVVADTSYELLEGDHTYPAFSPQLAPVLPVWELHHGFDVPKLPGERLPIALPELMERCAEVGLDNGGWFIFKNDEHWAFRSNEFADGSQADATARVTEQARALRSVLLARGIDVDVGFSLERVHGIWTFPAQGPNAA